MSSQGTEATTANGQSSSIPVIATPTQEAKSLVDILGGHFNKDPVSQEIDKEGVRAFGDDTYVSTEEEQKSTWTNLFGRQQIKQYQQIWKQHSTEWKNLDTKWANSITNFKEQNILTLGDIRVRSVLMAFTSALVYKTISWNTTGFFRKSRNLGISFVLTGYLFVPELFNPFLKKQKLNQTL